MIQLNALDLSSNNISHIDVGAFDLRRLEYVSLAHNDLSSVAAGVFGEALDTMWVTDNANLTCDQVERSGALPSGANCVDDSVCDARMGIAWLAGDVCSAKYDPKLVTEECLWDAGEC